MRAEPFSADEPIVDLAADASLRAAALACSVPGGASTVLPVPHRALRRKVRTRTRKTLVVFAVDASESMAAQERMAMAKGAALAILRTAYLRRDRVAVVVFEGESARVLLEPTPSIDQARLRLHQLPIGGATPLAGGLRTAWQVIISERQREPQIAATLVLLSDGRANVPLARQADPRAEVLALADRIRADGVFSLVVDTEALYPTQPELVTLAEHLGGRILRLGRGGTSALVSAVRRA